MDDEGRLENLLGAVILAAGDRVRPVIEAGLGQKGSAVEALVHLADYSGESTEQLSRVLGISQPGAVAVVERLVSAGLVDKRPGPDRRTRALHLSAAGHEVVAELLDARRQSLATLLEPLSAEQRGQLEPVLAAVVAGLANDRPEARRRCRLCDRRACCTGPGCPLDHTVIYGHKGP